MHARPEGPLDRWLDERCRRDPGGRETTASLYAAWTAWATAAGEFVGSQKRFARSLIAQNFEKWREPGTGRHGFRGITLNRAACNSSDRGGLTNA